MNQKGQEALEILNLCGCRLLPYSGGFQIGVWPNLRCEELQTALRVAGVGACELVDLNDTSVLEAYRIRNCPQRRPNEPLSSWRKRAEALRRKQAA